MARRTSSLFQLQQSQSVRAPLVPVVFSRWLSHIHTKSLKYCDRSQYIFHCANKNTIGRGIDLKCIHDLCHSLLSLVISLLGQQWKWRSVCGCRRGLVYCWAVTTTLYPLDTPSVTHGCTPAHTDIQAEYKSAWSWYICLLPRPCGLSETVWQ